MAQANILYGGNPRDEAAVREFLVRDGNERNHYGGPYGWDALTHLCFSRYLRLDERASDAFVRTARALLEAGASANTGWYEMIDYPNPRPVLESAIYGAAGIAHHAALRACCSSYGADPNDEETPYHAAEEYDLSAVRACSKAANSTASHDHPSASQSRLARYRGIRLLLEHGADPNYMTLWHQRLAPCITATTDLKISL